MNTKKALTKWLARRRRELAPSTMEYVLTLSRGWERRLGHLELEEVKAEHLEELEGERNDGRRSAGALNTELAYLRQFFRWAMEYEWVQRDPTKLWKYRRAPVKKVYVEVTAEEEARLLEAAGGLGGYIVFSVCTGLRQGTVRRLKWDHIDAEGVLVIPPELMKQRRAHRLPLPLKVMDSLGPRRPGELLFPGLPDARRLWKEFRKAAKKAGLPESTSPHDLRRTWVARLQRAGADLNTVMGMGGWSSLSTLLKHYFPNVSDARAREMMERVSR